MEQARQDVIIIATGALCGAILAICLMALPQYWLLVLFIGGPLFGFPLVFGLGEFLLGLGLKNESEVDRASWPYFIGGCLPAFTVADGFGNMIRIVKELI